MHRPVCPQPKWACTDRQRAQQSKQWLTQTYSSVTLTRCVCSSCATGETRCCFCRTNFWLQTVSKRDVGVEKMRRIAEVLCRTFSKQCITYIRINMKPAQVRILSGDIYTIRPAEKCSACAGNSHETDIWHILLTAGSSGCSLLWFWVLWWCLRGPCSY